MTLDGPYISPLAVLGIADLEAINSSPRAIIPAPGLGKGILITGVIATFQPGAEALTGGGFVRVGTGTTVTGITANVFTAGEMQGTDPICLSIIQINGTAALQSTIENLAVFVFASADFVGGPSVAAKLRIQCQYYIITNGWS